MSDHRPSLREIREQYMALGYEDVDSGPVIGRGNSESCGDCEAC